MLNFSYSGGEISSTTLSKAAGLVCSEIGGTTTGLKYYDFRYEDASKMMIIVESTTGTNFFKVTVPTSFATYAVDWSHYASTSVSSLKNGWSRAYLDEGSPFSSFGKGKNWAYGSLTGQFENGIEHEIKIKANDGTGRIGLVLEYAD